MAIADRATVIGVTGPFGSGCSEARKILAERCHFTPVSLSQDVLRPRWYAADPNKESGRVDFQRLGDQIRRESNDPGALVRLALASLDADGKSHEKIVIDAIRNVGEIEALQRRFGSAFFLFALECPMSERWERMEPDYERRGLHREHFIEDDQRDRDEEDIYGQQVILCVDHADVLIVNDDDMHLRTLRKIIPEYVRVVTGEEPRYATPAEYYMNIAYAAADGSKCLKRQVGAVIVQAKPNERGYIVAQGHNENPRRTAPCVDETAYSADPMRNVIGKCYRDIIRHAAYVGLAAAKCPACGTVIGAPANELPPWRCPGCGTNLDTYFFPDRAMSVCTAIHAEAQAIFAAGRRAEGATLYTTTQPCFQCAEAIIEAGVRCVVFTEPYADIRSALRLNIGGVEQKRFQGVRSARFREIFGRARPHANRLQEH